MIRTERAVAARSLASDRIHLNAGVDFDPETSPERLVSVSEAGGAVSLGDSMFAMPQGVLGNRSIRVVRLCLSQTMECKLIQVISRIASIPCGTLVASAARDKAENWALKSIPNGLSPTRFLIPAPAVPT